MNTPVTAEVVTVAVGAELRRIRGAHGWTRQRVVSALPSGIGDRTLLSYECGVRHMSLGRFVEICVTLGQDAPTVLSRALQRARLHAQSLVLWVDLRALLREERTRFPPLRTWARNRLKAVPEGIVELTPRRCGTSPRFWMSTLMSWWTASAASRRAG